VHPNSGGDDPKHPNKERQQEPTKSAAEAPQPIWISEDQPAVVECFRYWRSAFRAGGVSGQRS
jgi:hypothetical protein